MQRRKRELQRVASSHFNSSGLNPGEQNEEHDVVHTVAQVSNQLANKKKPCKKKKLCFLLQPTEEPTAGFDKPVSHRQNEMFSKFRRHSIANSFVLGNVVGDTVEEDIVHAEVVRPLSRDSTTTCPCFPCCAYFGFRYIREREREREGERESLLRLQNLTFITILAWQAVLCELEICGSFAYHGVCHI
jgi:hypothetical protein